MRLRTLKKRYARANRLHRLVDKRNRGHHDPAVRWAWTHTFIPWFIEVHETDGPGELACTLTVNMGAFPNHLMVRDTGEPTLRFDDVEAQP